jgi:predicted TIM-barrel fold metal-dependent hydrolase
MSEDPRHTGAASTLSVRHGIVDVDVHPGPASPDEIKQYMSMPWRDRYKGDRRSFYRHPVHGSRQDSVTAGVGPECSDPDLLRRQLLDEHGVAYAVLIMRTFCNIHPDPDYATAIAAAFNEWLADTWLSKHNTDGAFKGSITIAQQDPAAAAEEIERWAGHPHVVQVTMDSGARAPSASATTTRSTRRASATGCHLRFTPAQAWGSTTSPRRAFRHYSGWYCGMSLAFHAHLTIFLTEGVFERFPTLKIVFVEGGVAWLAPLIWRLDSYWKSLRAEVPWVKKPPSEYLRDHLRLGTQPLERPDDDKHLLQLFEMMDAKHLLMFSSDYPHWDFDSPSRAFPKLPTDMRDAIFSDNARSLYELD